MCGICGFISANGAPADHAVITAMNERLRRRGPDDEGYMVRGPVALGMRRLSIIDLQTGQQPMANEDGTVWVVLNGEIYNFPELRQELESRGHRFRSRSDTEVLVHLYEEHGPELVEHLNGMFAFAVWDEPRRRLLLARDPMGQKPLYWARIGDGLVFASEPKSLLVHPAVHGELDPRSLSRYLFYEYVPAPWSVYRGVYKLPAGHRLVFEHAAAAVTRYWELPAPEPPAAAAGQGGTDAAPRLWELLRASVRREMVSDVPLGVFLSGGLDSTSVLAAMASLMPAREIRTFTIGFEDPSFDESGPARRVAEHFGTQHHEQIFSVAHLLDLLPGVADYLDEPLGDASVLPMHLLSRFARERVKVALGGDGSDELLAGYPTFQAMRAAAVYRALPRALQRAVRWGVNRLPVSHENFSLDFKLRQFVRGAAAAPELAHQLWLGSFNAAEQRTLLSAELRAELDGWDAEAEHAARAEPLAGMDLVNRLTRLYAETYLAEDILTKTDRASMAASLELRAPFLDPALVRFVAALPPALKLRGNETKVVLRRAVAPHLPAGVLQRPKKGFGIPVARWLNTELGELVNDLLAPHRLRRQGLFDAPAVARLLDEHRGGQHNHRKGLWTLLMFQMWYDRYGEREAHLSTVANRFG